MKNRLQNSPIPTVRRAAAIKTILESGDKWPSSYVARSKSKEFTGGLYSPGYLANCDSVGTGPEGVFKVGRQNCYPVDSFCNWLIARLSA